MANKANTTLPNYVGGELSPYMDARIDLDVFKKSLEWCQNFLVLPQGGATYRPGTRCTGLTKGNAAGALIPFQFSANDAYMIVATDQKFRFYRNSGVILNTAITITGVTNANPGVVTAASHGFSNGDEVYISSVDGIPEINSRFYKVANKTTNTFELTDQFGNNVNSTNYGTYSSGGTVASIYELSTPYLSADLLNLRKAQTGDLMYLTNRSYAQRKLTRTGHTSWTLSKFTRTNDPFFPTASEVSITGMTIANPAVFTTSGVHGFAVGDRVFVEGTGTSQLQNHFLVIKTTPTTTTFTAYYDDGTTVVDSTGWTHSNGSTVVGLKKFPAVVAFTADGRIVYANTQTIPEGIWGSKTPNSATAATQYDDFTTGSNATDAYAYSLAPVAGIIDSIQEIVQFGTKFALLGASSIRQLYGATQEVPPTPTAINTQPATEGSLNVTPLVVGNTLLFVDVSGKKLKGLKYSLASNDFEASNFNLVADHLGAVSFKKVIRVKGDPDTIWVLRSDGLLLSFMFNDSENLAGWARHTVGGSGVVEDIATIRRDSGEDQLWLIVKRVMGGHTYRSVEVMGARPAFPQRRSFYSGDKDGDKERYENATWEQIKDPTFLDMTLTFDGTARGTEKNATITPSAVTGPITITSNNAVFRADHIGREIWKRYDSTGVGGGQAVITGYVSSTMVFATVNADFDSISAIAPGSWEFAVNEIKNLQLYEGLTVNVQADGSGHPEQVVTNGKIELQQHSARINVGFKYQAMMATHNIDIGGLSGPANSKPRNITRVRLRVKDTVGCKVGPSEYSLKEVIFRRSGQIMGRVPPPYSGMKDLLQLGLWNNDSDKVVIFHEDPTPCTVLAQDIEVFTVDGT